jgi:type IX secretion system PorP/SprF family membrane protein
MIRIMTSHFKKYVLVMLIIAGCYYKGSIAMAQDPQLSQFYSAPLYLGPSFAGAAGVPRIGTNIRAQWVHLPNPYLTTSLYGDKYFEKYKLGAGLSIMNDDAAGLMNSMYISTQYSYRITIRQRWNLVPGIQAQYFSSKINSGNLVFYDQIIGGEVLPTTVETVDDSRHHHFDFALSGLVFSDRYWFGITGNHLMKLNQNIPNKEDYAPFLFSAYGGIVFDMLSHAHITKTEKNITVTFHYKTQEKLHQLDLGLYHTNAPFMVGIWYRGIPVISNTQTKDALTLLLGYQTGPVSFAYSYDFTMSKLINSTGGSHEISINYKFVNPNTNRRKRIHAVPCPHF